ncbi:MAG: c-type cytochrome [Marinovum sp.]|nr:c-type cytochrome [Marinovum sp.]
MNRLPALLAILVLALSLSPAFATFETRAERKARILAPTSNFARPEQFELFQGGAGTNRTRLDENAFSLPSANLSFEERSDFFIGNGVFDRPWVPAPSSTIGSDGLGPLFNARSCQGCHIKDGRGHPPSAGDVNIVSMLFALSDTEGGPDPVFGHQFQDQAIVGFHSEGRIDVSYDEVPFAYPDGTAVTLRRPTYKTQAALAEDVSLNPRIAPQMIGLGLIDAISEEDIEARADPYDLDGDGISGRVSMADGRVGRFGWKAQAPSLLAQTVAAFSNDMGLSTVLASAPWGDCTEAQPTCRNARHGNETDGVEIADDLLDLVTFYSSHLAVPARRDVDDPKVLRGKELFYQAQCTACHTPKFATSAYASEPLRNQLIWPYSDLLLHDLGPGLADQNPSGDISGAEWRTPPLWGIGMTEAVSDHTFFLHDGRARSLEEAILWHGGEAETSRDAFATFPADDRAALLRFLSSL